jgi:hypothetical protein
MEEGLGVLAARSRPVAMAGTRTLAVRGALGGLFPEGGIQRGSTVTVGPVGPVGPVAGSPGGISLALALVAAATAGGGWAAAVGLPSLGLVAAGELGVGLERLALVPVPGERWPVVVAALLDGVDLLLLGVPPGRVRAADARRLAARARERGTVLVVSESGSPGGWPESPDLRLQVTASTWSGLGAGHGRLHARRVEVAVTGRRAAGRERRVALWLPGPDGKPAVVEESGEVQAAGAASLAG